MAENYTYYRFLCHYPLITYLNSGHFCVCWALEIILRGLREKLKNKIQYVDDNAEQNNAKETPSKVSILSGHGTEDDDNDPDDKDLKSNQKSAKSGDLCIEIKLGKNILLSVLSHIFIFLVFWSL